MPRRSSSITCADGDSSYIGFFDHYHENMVYRKEICDTIRADHQTEAAKEVR